jgi:hypothetical protein
MLKTLKNIDSPWKGMAGVNVNLLVIILCLRSGFGSGLAPAKPLQLSVVKER